MSNQITGRLAAIGQTVQIPSKTGGSPFLKREFLLDATPHDTWTGERSQYENIVPLESNISRRLRNRGYDTKGKEAHHWNYNLPYSIFLLSRKAHRCIHQFINVNYLDKYCYTMDGKKIDTVEKAISVFSSILKSNGINEELKVLNISL